MSEIELLYKNAGVGYQTYIVNTNPPVKYPQIDFSAEKQLKIIAFLVNKGYNVTFANLSNKFSLEQISKSLALCINSKWNNLTESEQEHIRSILNG